MGFYVDIAELQKAQEAYMKMVATAQSQLDTAKNGMNAIITSNSMYGEVGKAITNEINNVHNPVIVGLKNSLEFLGSEFSKTITDFQNLVGETSATAVLAEETLDDAVKKLNEADEKHKVMDTNFKSIYDGISSLYHLSAPLSSTFYTNTQTARKYVQDTKNKVNAFDKMTTTSSAEQLFSALSSQMAAAGRVKSLSYRDPVLTNFVAHDDLGKAIYELDQQYAKAKAEAIEVAKRKAEQEAAEREASYRRHHPIQAWLKDRSNEIGSWWGDVVEGTRNLPIPQDLKDTLLFAEGFIGSAGSMVSETAIGAVDLTQIIGIASIDGVNRLTGGQTPEWMKRDLQGTVDNLSSLAELGVGTYTALTDPGAAMRGQDPNASYADKAAYRAQETGKALWDKVTHMDAYDAGGLTFEIASLFVGPAAVGKMAKGTKLGAKAAEMIQLAKNSTKARVLANVEKWGSKVDNILAKSNNVIGKFGEKLLDTRIPVGIRKEAVAFAGGMGTMPTFSVESKTLREVMRFSSKHADDVVRVSDDAGKVADKVGDILRDGSHFDGAGKLKPNVRYQAGEHNYLYQTDELGRISEAYADNLQLKLHDGRLRHKENTPDKLPDDHAGHIFGDLFGGSPELDNLLSQAKDVNLKEYRRLEREWMNALKNNKKVSVSVKIKYDGNSLRPSKFQVRYKIDRKTRIEIIRNINKR